MPLSDVEIQIELERGRIGVDPVPLPERMVASSLDLLLHAELSLLPERGANAAQGITVDPVEMDVMSFLDRNKKTHDLSQSPYEMRPGEFLLAKTYEIITLPADISARVEGRSTLGRLGLGVHITAPTIQAGYQGRLTLEMFNAGPYKIKLTEQMNICQIIFERLTMPATAVYHGQFQGTE